MAEDTKEKILAAALKIFSDYSYHAASMTMITEEAGVSKGSLYWHFESKEELFRELVLTGLELFSTEFKNISNKNISAEEKIMKIIKFGVGLLVENSKIANILRNNVELVSSDFHKELEVKHQRNIDVFTKIIKQGIKEGSIRSENPRNTAVMMLTVLFTSHADWLLNEFEDKDKEIKFIYDFIMNGIRERSNYSD